jgi:hypothetical protein
LIQKEQDPHPCAGPQHGCFVESAGRAFCVPCSSFRSKACTLISSPDQIGWDARCGWLPEGSLAVSVLDLEQFRARWSCQPAIPSRGVPHETDVSLSINDVKANPEGRRVRTDDPACNPHAR